MAHGGKRKGSGRKPDPNAKIGKSFRLSPRVAQWLESLENQSVTVDAVLQRCKDYRDWSRQQDHRDA